MSIRRSGERASGATTDIPTVAGQATGTNSAGLGRLCSFANPAIVGNGQSMPPKKCQAIPVSALEPNSAIDDIEEAAAPKSGRIAPFEDGPFPILEQILDDAFHFGVSELAAKHGPDRTSTSYGFLNDLVIGGIVCVEFGERVGIRAVERIDPSFNDCPGCSHHHSFLTTGKSEHWKAIGFMALGLSTLSYDTHNFTP